MRKRRFLLLILLLVLAVISVYGWQNQDDFKMNPFDPQIALHNPYKIKTDAQNNLYVIDDAKQALIKIDRDGTVQEKIAPPELDLLMTMERVGASDSYDMKYNDETIDFLTYEDVAVDAQGYIYTLLRMMDENVLLLHYETIVRYTPDGQLDESWGSYVRAYDVAKQDSLSGGTIMGLEMQDDQLYMVTQEPGGKLAFSSWLPDKKQWQQERVASIQPGQYIAGTTGVKSQQTYYAMQSGELYNDEFGLLYPLEPSTREQPKFAKRVQADVLGNLYFIDEYGVSIKRLQPSNPRGVETMVTAEQVQRALLGDGKREIEYPIQSLGVSADGTLFLTMNNRVVIDRDGQLQPMTYSPKMQFLHWVFWTAMAVGGALLLWLCKVLYVDIMPRSLIYKQLFILVPLVVGVMMALASYLHGNFRLDTENEVRRALSYVAHDGQNLVSIDAMNRIQSPQDFMSADYQALKSKLNFEDHFGKYYMMIHRYLDGRLYTIVQDDNDFDIFSSFEVNVKDPNLTDCMRRNPVTDEYEEIGENFDYEESLDKHEYLTCKSHDQDGTWLFALGPLFNADKTQVVGVYEAGINTHGFEQRMNANWQKTLQLIAGITGLVLLIILIVALLQLRSIRQLRRSVTEVASGNWNIEVDVRSRDEVADLGNRFNDMARFIRGYVEEITLLRDSYFRFVPQSFLNLIGKQSILEVELGDAVQQEASVLVSSIRSFHVLSKDMTPEDSFQFINRLLHQVSPVVHRNGGLINKYLGDGILALFPNEPAQALRAGVEMLRVLEEYNAGRERKGKTPFRVGIGINHGPMMLGIIGAEQRLEGSVISDAVNFATILEGITERLGANILIPSRVLQEIPDGNRYLSRTLGLIHVEGLDQALELVDVFEADDDESRRLKLKTRETFELAIIMYQQGRFYDAREAFLSVIKQNQNDKTAKLYFYICDANFQRGTAGEWSGSLDV